MYTSSVDCISVDSKFKPGPLTNRPLTWPGLYSAALLTEGSDTLSLSQHRKLAAAIVGRCRQLHVTQDCDLTRKEPDLHNRLRP